MNLIAQGMKEFKIVLLTHTLNGFQNTTDNFYGQTSSYAITE